MSRRAVAAAALLLCTSAAQASLLARPDDGTARSRILQDIRVLQPALAPRDAMAVDLQARQAASIGELEAVRELARGLATGGGATVARSPGSEELWAAKDSGLQLRARVGSHLNRGHWMNSPDGRRP